MSIIILPMIDVIKDVYIPLNKIWGSTFLKSSSKLNASLIPMYVANIPSKEDKIHSNKILLVLHGSFIFFIKMKIIKTDSINNTIINDLLCIKKSNILSLLNFIQIDNLKYLISFLL